jgi:hypothetical protein
MTLGCRIRTANELFSFWYQNIANKGKKFGSLKKMITISFKPFSFYPKSCLKAMTEMTRQKTLLINTQRINQSNWQNSCPSLNQL